MERLELAVPTPAKLADNEMLLTNALDPRITSTINGRCSEHKTDAPDSILGQFPSQIPPPSDLPRMPQSGCEKPQLVGVSRRTTGHRRGPHAHRLRSKLQGIAVDANRAANLAKWGGIKCDVSQIHTHTFYTHTCTFLEPHSSLRFA